MAIVTLAEFAVLRDVDLATINSIVILAGPRPRNEAAQKVLSDVSSLLAKEAKDKVQIELALAHSCGMIAKRNLAVDAGRTDGAREKSRS